MKIIIAPYSARLHSGNKNPKEYPYWTKLVELLSKDGYEVIQIGVTGEERILGVKSFLVNLSFNAVKVLINDAALWISVDSWLPHFCHAEKLKSGVVLFGPSDPRIFGHPQNINLLRGRDYLRPFQFQTWSEWNHSPQAFVYAENVVQSVYKLAPMPLTRKLALV